VRAVIDEAWPGPGATTSAADSLPEELSLPALREAAAGYQGCNREPEQRETEFAAFVGDLRFVGSLL